MAMDPDRLIEELTARYRRFHAAWDEGDYTAMADGFARLCDWLRKTDFDPRGAIFERAFAETHLVWADLFWDAGRPDLTAEVIETYLETFPDDEDARVRHAAAMFHACRFDAAREELLELEDEESDNPDVFIYLAALAERERDGKRARRYYHEAQQLDDTFKPPLELGEQKAVELFRKFLQEAPPPIRDAAADIPIFCAPLPSDETLLSESPPLDPWILGLFEGPDVGQGDVAGVVSPRILLFHKNIARFAHNERELENEMRLTLFHEIGHYVGMDEDDLQEWEHEEGEEEDEEDEDEEKE